MGIGTIISWIIIGLLAGALARLIMPGDQAGGWGSAILLGLVGAVIGGFLGGLIFGGGIQETFAQPWSLSSFISAVVGALIFMFIYGLLNNKRGTARAR